MQADPREQVGRCTADEGVSFVFYVNRGHSRTGGRFRRRAFLLLCLFFLRLETVRSVMFQVYVFRVYVVAVVSTYQVPGIHPPHDSFNWRQKG